jgi:alpha-1,4-digalacturonate transport system substrate-binding protein
MMKYFLDLRPYLKDADYWDKNYALELPWMRPNAEDTGIYGLPTNLSLTGAFINRSLFDQADVPVPGPTATWDDWVAASRKVAAATKTPYAMAFDRSGHRFAAAAIAYGAKYFAADGTPAVVDDGFKSFASRFYQWSRDGVVDNDVWLGAAGGYRDAFDDFQNGKIVLYYSGSWNVQRVNKQIGDSFKWQMIGNPCGTAGCIGGMPGGTILVAYKQTKNPEAVAKYLDWFAQPRIFAEWMVRTGNVSPNLEVLQSGLHYNLSDAGNAALAAFTESAPKISPVGYHLQGYPYTRSIYTPTVDRLSQAIGGQITLDQAYERITADVAQAVAASRH